MDFIGIYMFGILLGLFVTVGCINGVLLANGEKNKSGCDFWVKCCGVSATATMVWTVAVGIVGVFFEVF